MSRIIAYIPTYSQTEAEPLERPYTRLSNDEIAAHFTDDKYRSKPSMYMDVIDSIINTRPDVKLVVADGRSTDSVRGGLIAHHYQANAEYDLMLYAGKKSQWWIFNDILAKYATEETEYFIYSSSDVIWQMDWVEEAIKAFEANPKLQILFPCVNRGDPNLPSQIATGPRDIDPIIPPYQPAARAKVLNAYVMIFRMDFLRTYGGYPTAWRNCFTESFLNYMCEAMGGEMRILPRGWCFHWGEGDKWTDGGSPYYYTEEKGVFDAIMNDVLMHKAMNLMSVDFLKKKLYRTDEKFNMEPAND